MGLFDLKNKRKSVNISKEDESVVGDITESQSFFPATTDGDVATEPDKTAVPSVDGDPTPKSFSAEEDGDAASAEPTADKKVDAEEVAADADKVAAEADAEAAEEEVPLDDAQKADLANTVERLETAMDTVNEIVSDVQEKVASETGEVPESTIKTAELAVECLLRVCEFDNSPYVALESYANRAAFVISRGNMFVNHAKQLIQKINACLK